LQSEGSF